VYFLAKSLSAAARGAVNAPGIAPDVKIGLLNSAKETSNSIVHLLDAVKGGKRGGASVSQCSGEVAKGVNSVVAAASKLPGGARVSLEPRTGQDLDEVAQKELLDASRAIAAVAQQLASRPRQQSPGKGPIDLGDVSEGILDAAQAIASAAGTLLSAAAQAQKERVAGMKNPETKHLYHKDPVWADGLISAARAVVGTTNHLVGVANAAAKGTGGSEEEVVAAAKAVAASTAHLVSASRARGGTPGLGAGKGLEDAAKSIAMSTTELVKAVKIAGDRAAEAKLRQSSYGLTRTQAAEIEAQTRILKLERELELARNDLGDMRKAKYTGNNKK